eukprot:Lankesteria_metandrocarpae@DN8434_c0_g1_i1.p1
MSRPDSHLLRFYYDRIFPFNLLFKWLTYHQMSTDPNYFAKREFAIVMARGEDDIYSRWNAFKSAQAWRQKIITQEIPPHKMDIGALYSIPVSDKQTFSHSFRPLERELVFDIDMDDYDEIRSCCKEKKVCIKCWKFLSLAMRLLTESLREDFGFTHVLWVFSGRRGLHGWVVDEAARILPSDARAGIIDYLTLVTGSAHQRKKVSIFNRNGRVHPMITRAYNTSCLYFDTIVEDQLLFERDSKNIETVFAHLSRRTGDAFKTVLEQEWTSGSSIDFWTLLRKYVPKAEWTSLAEIVLSFSYPRLDVNVSKDISHLLKAPFCCHLATGKLCVPIPPEMSDSFDPSSVPTIQQVVNEYKSQSDGLLESSLSPYFDFFEHKFLQPVLTESMAAKQNHNSF